MKIFEFRNSKKAVFFAMIFYVCGPNLKFVSCKSTALWRFTWNNFFYKNGPRWPQFYLYNFWPWVTSGKRLQRMRRIDARRGTKNFKPLFLTEFELLSKNHQGCHCPPSGRGLIPDMMRGTYMQVMPYNFERCGNVTLMNTDGLILSWLGK